MRLYQLEIGSRCTEPGLAVSMLRQRQLYYSTLSIIQAHIIVMSGIFEKEHTLPTVKSLSWHCITELNTKFHFDIYM